MVDKLIMRYIKHFPFEVANFWAHLVTVFALREDVGNQKIWRHILFKLFFSWSQRAQRTRGTSRWTS